MSRLNAAGGVAPCAPRSLAFLPARSVSSAPPSDAHSATTADAVACVERSRVVRRNAFCASNAVTRRSVSQARMRRRAISPSIWRSACYVAVDLFADLVRFWRRGGPVAAGRTTARRLVSNVVEVLHQTSGSIAARSDGWYICFMPDCSDGGPVGTTQRDSPDEVPRRAVGGDDVQRFGRAGSGSAAQAGSRTCAASATAGPSATVMCGEPEVARRAVDRVGGTTRPGRTAPDERFRRFDRDVERVGPSSRAVIA